MNINTTIKSYNSDKLLCEECQQQTTITIIGQQSPMTFKFKQSLNAHPNILQFIYILHMRTQLPIPIPSNIEWTPTNTTP